MKLILIQSPIYIDGQTDGMSLYKMAESGSFVYGANEREAKMRAKAGLTISVMNMLYAK